MVESGRGTMSDEDDECEFVNEIVSYDEKHINLEREDGKTSTDKNNSVLYLNKKNDCSMAL